jgi:hypothetical protein
MKCKHCGEEVKANCDWRQGRCPHAPSTLERFKECPYHTRYYNLINVIKNLFNRG